MASLALAVHLDGRAQLTADERSSFAGSAARPEERPDRRRQAPWMEAAWIDADRSPLGARAAADEEAGLWLVLAGRIDNREELLAASRPIQGNDAELVLDLYKRFQLRAFERLVGPFACVVVEESPRRVVMARDRGAGRWLCFHRRGDLLWIADRPSWLGSTVRNPGLDDETVRRFFELRAPASGATFFNGVQEAPPGTALAIDRDRTWREVYPPLPVEDGSRWTDRDWEARFLFHLEQAVDRRMDTADDLAVLMSGGLDSTAVAALAAERLSAPLTTISWIFKTTPEADERPYIDSVNRHLKSHPVEVPGDEAVPSPEMLRPSPDGPFEGPYRRLRRDTYERLTPSRCVLLTGEMGDELLAADDRWLVSLLRAGRRREALSEIGAAVKRCRGLRGTGLRAAFGHCRPAAAGTPAAGTPAAGTGPFTPFTTWPCHLEAVEAARYGLEIRRPFLDVTLRAFVESLPAHLISRPGRSKRVLRRALEGRLPETVLHRSWSSSLLPLPRQFVRRYGPDLWHDLLETPQSCVFDYVDRDRLESLLRSRSLCRENDGPLWVIAWRSVIFELWYRHRYHSTRREAYPSSSLQVA